MTQKLLLRYSNDGGHNYTDPRFLDMGDTGDFQKPVIARRLGMTRHRIWEVSYDGDRRCDLLAASVQVEGE